MREELTDVAPHRGGVDHVILPDVQVDSVEETLPANPKDIENTSNVPGCVDECQSKPDSLRGGEHGALYTLEMPVERDADQDETDEREYGDDVDLIMPGERHAAWYSYTTLEQIKRMRRASRFRDDREGRGVHRGTM